MLALKNFRKSPDGVGELHVFSLCSRELLGDKERLREKLLNFSSPSYNEFIFIG